MQISSSRDSTPSVFSHRLALICCDALRTSHVAQITFAILTTSLLGSVLVLASLGIHQFLYIHGASAFIMVVTFIGIGLVGVLLMTLLVVAITKRWYSPVILSFFSTDLPAERLIPQLSRCKIGFFVPSPIDNSSANKAIINRLLQPLHNDYTWEFTTSQEMQLTITRTSDQRSQTCTVKGAGSFWGPQHDSVYFDTTPLTDRKIGISADGTIVKLRDQFSDSNERKPLTPDSLKEAFEWLCF